MSGNSWKKYLKSLDTRDDSDGVRADDPSPESPEFLPRTDHEKAPEEQVLPQVAGGVSNSGGVKVTRGSSNIPRRASGGESRSDEPGGTPPTPCQQRSSSDNEICIDEGGIDQRETELPRVPIGASSKGTAGKKRDTRSEVGGDEDEQGEEPPRKRKRKSEKADRGPHGKNWCFTSFMDAKPSFDPELFWYIVYQREKAPDTGRLHWQGFCHSKKRMYRRAVQLAIGDEGAHMECARSIQHAIDYCCKADTRVEGPFEHGDKSKVASQGNRSDLEEVHKKLVDGQGLLEISDAHFSTFIRYHRGIMLWEGMHKAPRSKPPCITVIWGLTGVGKSLWAAEHHPGAFWLGRGNGTNVWWDGYHGQDTCIIDEFYGWLKWDFFLKLLDRYPLRVECKGGSVQFNSSHIIITSNKHWSEWYKSERIDMGPFIRRLRDYGTVFEVTCTADMEKVHCRCNPCDPKLKDNLTCYCRGTLRLAPHGLSPQPSKDAAAGTSFILEELCLVNSFILHALSLSLMNQ